MEYWRDVYGLVSAMQKDVSSVMQANYSQLAKTAASAIEQKMSSGAGNVVVGAGVVRGSISGVGSVPASALRMKRAQICAG